MARRYTINDLADALVEAEKFRDAHVDLKNYHGNRYLAMAGAFGAARAWKNSHFDDGEFELGEPSRINSDQLEAGYLVESCVRSLIRLSCASPFSGMLEAPKSIIDFYVQFNKPIRDGISQAEEGVLGMLVATLAVAQNIPSNRTVNYEDLVVNGLDTSLEYPDEYDYF